MKIALCCIGRLENNYAVEYIEYYKKIGFDKIFIYDNNYDGEEHFEDILQVYIDDGFVEIIDYRNKTLCQMKSYEECYNTHSNEYDWIAFLDFDEYITFKNDETIKEYLSDKKFNDFECIHLNWMYYGDNDIVKYDNRPLLERFTKPADYNLKITYDFPENNHVKSIVRGGINNFKWRVNTHSPGMGLKCCNNIGKKCEDNAFNPYNFDRCYIRHFATKTIEEWVKYRMKRGNADISYEKFRKLVNADRFFLVNKRTKEKEDLMNKLMLEIDKKKPQIDNIDIFIGTYKDFETELTESSYKVIYGKHNLKTNNGLKSYQCVSDEPLDDRFYSEIYMLKNLPKDLELKDYVGFCHYRKYFSFKNNIPDVENILSDNGIIVAKPLNYRITVKQQYASCHNIEDLYIISGILAEKYPEYIKMWNKFLNGHYMFPYNMFIMKREEFLEYINFVKDVLDRYVKIVGTDIKKRIESNKEKYLKDFSPNDSVEYQYRIGGYLGERLTNLFILTHHKKMRAYNVIITEKKYEKEI